MYFYPVWVRLWHILNAILVIILIITGLSIRFTGQSDSLFIMNFESAVKWHNVAAVLATICYVGFVTGNVLTENGKFYRTERSGGCSDVLKQIRYYIRGMFRGEKNPFPMNGERKFNPLQRAVYRFTMYFTFPVLIISGLLLMFPDALSGILRDSAGILLADILHIITGFIISVFLVIHIYSCTLGRRPLSLFRGIITGYQESEDD